LHACTRISDCIRYFSVYIRAVIISWRAAAADLRAQAGEDSSTSIPSLFGRPSSVGRPLLPLLLLLPRPVGRAAIDGWILHSCSQGKDDPREEEEEEDSAAMTGGGEEQGRSLFGVSLTNRPRWQQFMICSSGFFFGYLVNGICEVRTSVLPLRPSPSAAYSFDEETRSISLVRREVLCREFDGN
jgi:hypothetical protein